MHEYHLTNGSIIILENNCVCPYCHRGVSNEVFDIAPKDNINDILYLLVRCPLCKRIYFIENEFMQFSKNKFKFKKTFPGNIQLELPPTIETKFQGFAEIYRQSLLAENDGLDKIEGMGFRKAIEYLVKPYVKSLFPEKTTDIEQETLGKTIERIQYQLIKDLAKAANWLGNDQTHIQQ